MNDSEIIRRPGSEPRDRIVLALRRRGPQTRSGIARATGLAKSTVSEIVADLVHAGVVVADGQRPPTPAQGRPGTYVTLNPRAGIWVGIDCGFRHVRAAAVDVAHTVLADAEVFVGQDYSAQRGCEAAAEVTRTVIARTTVPPERVLGIGIAIPGPVDPRTGTILGTSMIPTWSGIDIRAVLADRLPGDISIDNESNCAALAEQLWGAGQGVRNMVYCKLHSGVGGGIVLDGRVVHGIAGLAGEFGHITVDPAGPLCRCGNRGCLESYVGIPALLEQVRAVHGSDITVGQMLHLAAAADPACQRVIAEAAELTGRVLATVANALSPELVVIGGALVPAGDLLLEPLNASFRRHSLIGRVQVPSQARTRIVLSSLGRNASALGAVALALSY